MRIQNMNPTSLNKASTEGSHGSELSTGRGMAAAVENHDEKQPKQSFAMARSIQVIDENQEFKCAISVYIAFG